jgi:hypothetical protein
MMHRVRLVWRGDEFKEIVKWHETRAIPVNLWNDPDLTVEGALREGERHKTNIARGRNTGTMALDEFCFDDADTALLFKLEWGKNNV